MNHLSVFCESETLDAWTIELHRGDVERNSFYFAGDVHLSPLSCTIGKLYILRENMELKILHRPQWAECIARAILIEYKENQSYYEGRRHVVLANCIKENE